MKNVTVKLEEELVRAARHLAVDTGQSLSGWLADLIRERLGTSAVSAKVVEALSHDRPHEDDGLAVFEEARRRALIYLDEPVSLKGDGEAEFRSKRGRRRRE